MTVIGIFLLLVVTLFPFPMSAQRLSSTRWCAPSVRDAHFEFAQRGEFYYGTTIISAYGGESIGGQGRWEGRGTSIHVVVDGGNIHENGYSFTIRPLLLGHALWSRVDMYGTVIVPIWRTC